MIGLEDKERVPVKFGLKEAFIWARWYLGSMLLGLLWLPFLCLISLPKVLSRNTMFVSFWFMLGLDWLLKRYFSELLANGRTIDLIDNWLSLTLVHNKGAAFGMMKGWGWFFILMAIISCAVILVILALWREKYPLTSWALVFILSGAIGNMIDRIEFNHVIDYILVYHGDWKFPVFNFADMAINVGVGLIALDVLFDQIRIMKEASAGKEN